jgi:hypothetical protein
MPANTSKLLSRAIAPTLVAGLAACLFAGSAGAQELSPRAYWPAPVGTKLLVAGYQFASGDVVTDASLPVTGVDSRIHTGLLAYQQTFGVAGRTSNLQVEMPYTSGTTTGQYLGRDARADVSGAGDLALTFAINLFGAPAMDRAAFREFLGAPEPVLGVSLKLVAPTGEYYPDKLINIGTNRWAGRLQLGYIHPLGRGWALEGAVGAWVFQDNDDFLGTTREQNRITSVELHVVKVFRSGIWTSVDVNYYTGGRTTVGGDIKADFQRNSRLGFTVAYPIARRHLVKLGMSGGVVTESGGDFFKLLLSYGYLIG